MHEATILSLPR